MNDQLQDSREELRRFLNMIGATINKESDLVCQEKIKRERHEQKRREFIREETYKMKNHHNRSYSSSGLSEKKYKHRTNQTGMLVKLARESDERLAALKKDLDSKDQNNKNLKEKKKTNHS